MKPFLRNFVPTSFEDIPDATAYEAGYLVTKNAGWRNVRYLVTKNAGWRNVRPVIDNTKCVGCLNCYLYCPDGVIFREGSKVNIDYDFCKGCGICSKICKPGAIKMEAEK